MTQKDLTLEGLTTILKAAAGQMRGSTSVALSGDSPVHGLDEAAVLATGSIEGNPVVAVVMDFRFLGGSPGSAIGELITLTAETALRERIPPLLSLPLAGHTCRKACCR